MNQTRQYRTRDEWQSIINHFLDSGLSGAQFCKQNTLPYGSFVKWRQKLSTTEATHSQTDISVSSSFLDLSALAATESSTSKHWHITLKLGNGVELVLSQG